MAKLKIKNDRLLKAIQREPVDTTPIWIMRQAGRYLPEYRAARDRARSFINLCKTPELACEVTLQPLRRYALDAAIIFSDILTIPDAMGLGLSVIEGKGPVFARPICKAAQIEQLQVLDLEKLNYVYTAISLVRQELAGSVPLIGFSGSPWTLAAYMIEGESRPGFPGIQKIRQEEPELLHKLLSILEKSVSLHLHAQIKAGADVVMIFDTWGGILDSLNYQEFSLNYIKQAIKGLQSNYNYKKVPVILFTKGGERWLEKMVHVGCDMLGLDSAIPLKEARSRVGMKVALQGNMDPAYLLKSEQAIRKEVGLMLDSFGYGSGHVFNLGHGITPDVPPEQVAILVDAVHELAKPYHA